jgi:hypothetical protein
VHEQEGQPLLPVATPGEGSERDGVTGVYTRLRRNRPQERLMGPEGQEGPRARTHTIKGSWRTLRA